MLNITVKPLSVIVAFVVLGAGIATAQQAGMQAGPATDVEQRLTGTISCAARITHQYTCQRNQTQQTCTLACVERGSEFVLVVGDHSYALDGNKHSIEKYAGGKATVIGTVTQDRISVHLISEAKQKLADARVGQN